jgi:chaperonin GroES
MSVHPIRDYVVVSKDSEQEEKRPSGIVLVATETKNVTGIVLAVGSGRVSMNGTVVPLEVVKGDKVVFNKNMATEVKDGHNVVFVLREDQVICVLK